MYARARQPSYLSSIGSNVALETVGRTPHTDYAKPIYRCTAPERDMQGSGCMAKEPDHSGKNEPRSRGETHHENRAVDLNTADVYEIADLSFTSRAWLVL